MGHLAAMHEHGFREVLCKLYKERKPGVDVFRVDGFLCAGVFVLWCDDGSSPWHTSSHDVFGRRKRCWSWR